MLQKSNSKKIFQLKYLLLVPIVFGMLMYTSCVDESTAQNKATDTATEEKTKVMQRIEDLSEAIMEKGNLTPEERKALTFLATPAKPGDKVYLSVEEFLDESKALDSPPLPDESTEFVTEEEVQDLKDVPFAVIDQVPLFPGCEDLDKEKAKKCTTAGISNHVAKQFNTKLANDLGLEGKQRISVQFKITKRGKITDVRARAPHPQLEKEAIRVVESLPKMTPGESKGKKVGVLYALPIVFAINN